MDVLMLSRLQFAAATFFHFLFVPLTLGLSILIAIMETMYVRTGDEEYRRMAKFWGKIFLINFAVGVVTGITLEFQFGTNWSRYSRYVGDIFGSLLAIEATLAFFLESTFLAVWIFGWKRLSPQPALRLHLAGGLGLQPLGLVDPDRQRLDAAPGGLRPPERPGRTERFYGRDHPALRLPACFSTPSAAPISWRASSSWGSAPITCCGGNIPTFFTKSFRLALSFALIFSVAEVVQGHHPRRRGGQDPAHQAGGHGIPLGHPGRGPHVLLLIPDQENERNLVEFGRIPGALSMLAYHSPTAVVKGLKDFPKEERPPVALTFLSFRLMVGLGFLFVLLTVVGWFKRRKLESSPGYLKVMLYAIPLPYLALQAGWIVTEVGRQPWIVYGLMKTSDAVSPIAASQVGITLAAFILVYSLLGAVAFYLISQTCPARAGTGAGGRQFGGG